MGFAPEEREGWSHLFLGQRPRERRCQMAEGRRASMKKSW